MKQHSLFSILALVLVATVLGCEGADEANGSNGNPDGDTDGDADGDVDTDADADGDGDTDIPNGSGTIHGTVMSPSGTFPIPGALVYLTSQTIEGINLDNEIPSTIFCYDCDDMTGKKWTLSNADGTFTLGTVPAGTWRLVTRKGYFRRIVEITIGEGEVQDVPVQQTTLPTENSADGADTIPSYAVALNSWDRPQDLLSKLGIADLGGDGHIVFGTENFDVYNDDMSQTGYPDSAGIYTNLQSMSQYHMIFMPCTSSHLESSVLAVEAKKQQIREYVAAGGKLYGSCYAYDWIEQPFPAMIEFRGDDASMGAGTVSSYNTDTTIVDQQMRDWLSVVSPAENPDAFWVTGAWVYAEKTDDVDNGMGLEEDDGWVIPKVWVWDNTPNVGWNCLGPGNKCPMTVTYNFGCGKVFFSAYQVVESSSSTVIRPQEYVLLYLILEVGVCEGEYVPPE
jgi:hypothetical protein